MEISGLSHPQTNNVSGKSKNNRNDDFAAMLAANMAQAERTATFSGSARAGATGSTPLKGNTVALGLGETRAAAGSAATVPGDGGAVRRKPWQQEQSASDLLTNTMLMMEMLNKDGNYQAMMARHGEGVPGAAATAAPGMPAA